MEWQSEQEKRESKSIFHSPKDTPAIMPKPVSVDKETGEKKSATPSAVTVKEVFEASKTEPVKTAEQPKTAN